MSSHPALPQASWLQGGGFASAPAVPSASSEPTEDPLFWLPAVPAGRLGTGPAALTLSQGLQPSGHAILGWLGGPLAHGAGTGNQLPVFTSGLGSQSRAQPQSGAWRPGTPHTRVLSPLGRNSGRPADLQFTDGETEASGACLGWCVCVWRGSATYCLRCPLRMSWRT